MESRNYKTVTKKSLLKDIDKYYIDSATNIVNGIRFDIETKDTDYLKFRVLSAVERILKTSLTCDYEIKEETLQKFKKLI